MKLLVLIAVIQLSLAAKDSLKPDFYNFISTNLSSDIAALLNRDDKVDDARTWAFGGNGKEPNSRRPVVFVHGFRSMASTMGPARSGFAANNFNGQRLLATTYGGGEKGWTDLDLSDDIMKCEYVKQIRHMLEATRNYYGSKVDVVAQSMGSPIARKAIHGGLCVDDPTQDLGPSMNNDIHTFVSVGGANYGASICGIGIGTGTCNKVNGLTCKSKFLKDINDPNVPPVGTSRYSFKSSCDEVLGLIVPCWGKHPTELAGAKTISMGCKNHANLLNGAESVQRQATIVASQN